MLSKDEKALIFSRMCYRVYRWPPTTIPRMRIVSFLVAATASFLVPPPRAAAQSTAGNVCTCDDKCVLVPARYDDTAPIRPPAVLGAWRQVTRRPSPPGDRQPPHPADRRICPTPSNSGRSPAESSAWMPRRTGVSRFNSSTLMARLETRALRRHLVRIARVDG